MQGEPSESRPDPKYYKDEEKDAKKRFPAMENTNIILQLSRESERIIKLKVAQSAANCMLKEELNQLELVRESQQENLIDLQMQYESLDGEYQNESKQREDLQYKVQNSRTMCNHLEGMHVQLAETLHSTLNDKRTLFEAYQNAVQVIKDAKNKFSGMEEDHKIEKQRLETQVNFGRQHNAEIMKLCGKTKATRDNYIKELKMKVQAKENELTEASDMVNEINSKYSEAAHEITPLKAALSEKNQLISHLGDELLQLEELYDSETKNFEIILTSKEKELDKYKETIKTLHEALEHHENNGKEITKAYEALEDKTIDLEDKLEATKQLLAEANKKEQETAAKNDELKTNNENYLAEIEGISKASLDKSKQIEKLSEDIKNNETEMKLLRDNLSNNQNSIADQNQKWTIKEQDFKIAIKELQTLLKTKDSNSNDSNKALEQSRIENENLIQKIEALMQEHQKQIEELTKTIESRDLDVTKKAAVIDYITAELKQCNSKYARLEMTIEKYEKEKDALLDNETSLVKKLRLEESNLECIEGGNKELTTSPVLTPLNKYYGPVQIFPEREMRSPAPPTKTVNELRSPKPKSTIYSYAPSPNSDSGDFLSDSSMDVPYYINSKDVEERFNKAYGGGTAVVTPMRIVPKKRKTSSKPDHKDEDQQNQNKFIPVNEEIQIPKAKKMRDF